MSSQPQQPQAGQQPQQQSLLKAADILKLQCLTGDEKQKYQLAMQNFWSMAEQSTPGSPEHTTARQRLAEFSQRFITRERTYRIKMKQQQQQQLQQGGQGQQGQPSQQNQGQNQNQNQGASQGQQAGNPHIKTEAPQSLNRSMENATGPQQPQSQQPSQNTQSQMAQQSAPRPGGAAMAQIEASIHKHVQDFPIQLPPQGPTPGAPDYETKIKEYRAGYVNMLMKQATVAENAKKLKFQIEERSKTGQAVPQEILMMKQRAEKEHASMKEQVERFRRLQNQWKQERERQQGQQGQEQAQPDSMSQTQPQQQQQQLQTQTHAQSPQQQPMQLQQPSQRHPQQPNMHMQNQIKDEPQIKVEGAQGPPQQPAGQFNMQGNQPQNMQNMQNMQMPPSLQQQQQQQNRAPPQHSQTMPGGQGHGPQFTQQGSQPHMQNRPQINPHQANQHHQNNSPHPQSATGSQPVPLSHSAAISAANQSYSDPQRTSTPMQQNGQGNFGSREREQLNNPKMPIPRHLNVTSPTPVHMGQARPTMSGPTNGAIGPMGQPVIPRPPPFQLEGEGDRVLSKRKLDELVRQVTGGSEEALTSEVEEVSLIISLHSAQILI